MNKKTVIIVGAIAVGLWYFLRNKKAQDAASANNQMVYAGGTPGFYDNRSAAPVNQSSLPAAPVLAVAPPAPVPAFAPAPVLGPPPRSDQMGVNPATGQPVQVSYGAPLPDYAAQPGDNIIPGEGATRVIAGSVQVFNAIYSADGSRLIAGWHDLGTHWNGSAWAADAPAPAPAAYTPAPAPVDNLVYAGGTPGFYTQPYVAPVGGPDFILVNGQWVDPSEQW